MKTEILYGRRAVTETIRAGRRKIHRLVLSEKIDETESVQRIISQARRCGLEVKSARHDWLDAQTRGANHQGFLLECGPYQYVELQDILDVASDRGEPPLLLLLDLLQDVQNVGTLLRTAEAVGVHGVILQERRAAGITPAVVNASSGAVEHLRIAQVTNLVQSMKTLKQIDVWLAGLDVGKDAVRYDQSNLRGALGLVVGSEGEGLRRLVRETCDFIIGLPMRGQIDSLNAAVAGSVALYAAWQARGFDQG
ncbi:MAG: 23S rRNA (guanosine(2251)-2'-O)-methyltransferase RlmB [Anaerolineae bacterium]|nr:23S rRNA (guanosine(2251)-2'-O)-methyltransferase RlmB [Anaerolineae bacterium]